MKCIKRSVSVILAAMMALSLSAHALGSTDRPIAVYAGGREIELPPVMHGGRIMFPLRAIFEAMGASVNWEGETSTVWLMNEYLSSGVMFAPLTNTYPIDNAKYFWDKNNGRVYMTPDCIMDYGYVPVWDESHTRLDIYHQTEYFQNLPPTDHKETGIDQGGTMFTKTRENIDYLITGLDEMRENDSELDQYIIDIESSYMSTDNMMDDLRFFTVISTFDEESITVVVPEDIRDVFDIGETLRIKIMPGQDVAENQTVVVSFDNIEISAIEDAYALRYSNIQAYLYQAGEQVVDFCVRTRNGRYYQRVTIDNSQYYLISYNFSSDPVKSYGEVLEYEYYRNLCTGEVYAKKGYINYREDKLDFIAEFGEYQKIADIFASYISRLIILVQHRLYPTEAPEKPVIYLYPEEPADVTVCLKYDGVIDYASPSYDNGWAVTAYPDGTLIDHSDGQEYPYLFWEGHGRVDYDLSKGFVVRGGEAREFLQDKLAYMGLLPGEYNEFIDYWLPRMQGNAYNLITFQGTAYTDTAALLITPAPDSVLRVFMAFLPLDEPIEIEEQILPTFARTGFVVVEWGGCMLRNLQP